MVRWADTGCLARTAGTYLAASARDLADLLLNPRTRPAAPPCDPPIRYEDPWEGFLNGEDDEPPFDDR